jgi:hypothetical protein
MSNPDSLTPFGKGNPGRPPGTKNKLGVIAKENIIAVFDKIGGVDKMAKWAGDNLTEFYKIYARLVPQDLRVDATIHDVTMGNESSLADKLAKHLAERQVDALPDAPAASRPTVQ